MDRNGNQDKTYLVAQHPRVSGMGFNFTDNIPENMEGTVIEKTLIEGFGIMHDHNGPGPRREVTNMFGSMFARDFPRIYGDCILVKIGKDENGNEKPMPPTFAEIKSVMKALGFPKDAWLTKDMEDFMKVRSPKKTKNDLRR